MTGNGRKIKSSNENMGSTLRPQGKGKARGHTSQRYYSQSFHLKLKHVLGGVSFLSLLAAFEVFSIPAASGIIDLFQFSQFSAGLTWIFVAMASGGIALLLNWGEKDI